MTTTSRITKRQGSHRTTGQVVPLHTTRTRRAASTKERVVSPSFALGWSLALLGIIVLAPLLVAIAAMIKASSPGPVLYRQRRVGWDGRTFEILKFRSMAPAPADEETYVPKDGEAPGGVEGLDRRTTVGRVLRRTSLDELPQLFNVLRGEMALVGPRPERPEFVELFVSQIDGYEDRHRVRAGITGWAQVHGLRGKTSIEARAAADRWYVENRSLWVDVKTLALTARAVMQPAE